VATLETTLTVAGVVHDLKIYPGTRHAFFNNQLKSYDAADSRRRVLAYFAEHIKGPEASA
jgi:carboxymethylenebutenolidase